MTCVSAPKPFSSNSQPRQVKRLQHWIMAI